MWQLASAIGEITLRHRGPEILPSSRFLTGLLLAIYVCMNLVAFVLHGGLTWLDLGELAAQVVLIFAFVFAVLAFFKLERRYLQTMSAILGINTVVILVYLPVALGGLALRLDIRSEPFAWIGVGFILWSLVIEAHILARAVSQPMILGFMLEILYVIPSLSITRYFSPAIE